MVGGREGKSAEAGGQKEEGGTPSQIMSLQIAVGKCVDKKDTCTCS